MEGTSILSCSSSSSSFYYAKTRFVKANVCSYSSLFHLPQKSQFFLSYWAKDRPMTLISPKSSLRTAALTVEETAMDKSGKEALPKIDKSGRFCSPRAARELALIIIYAACLEGSDPVRLFEKRLNARREPGYEFNKEAFLKYNHMSFGGPPVTAETVEEAEELLRDDERESATEIEVLSAPPKLVYSKLILRFTRKLLVAVVDKWDSNVVVINRVIPTNWQNEPAGKILELSILHLAMSEILVLGTRHQIVINEAVDLAKRFCDGAAPRIINGCLRTFLKELNRSGTAQVSQANEKVPIEV